MKVFLLVYLCTITYALAENTDLNTSTPNAQTMISKERVESELTNVLKNVKRYKENSNNRIKDLELKLASVERKFKQYKIKKNKEIKSLNHKLTLTKKKLLVSEKKVCEEREYIAIEEHILEKKIEKKQMEKTKWIKVTVQNDINIYDLALKYYGDAHQYEKIYVANQNLIGNDFELHNGMSLNIPLNETFQEQPTLLDEN